ncbi:hypothetical protein AGLY_003091 [Aphis glycines]|uniref:NADH dehydrogenase [ubiquinone] 1 beta subcomplex subunit 8, mitochondrial n=1 Tax=Aphis glycines TaxID=307491 RepID=A0A6G0U322_APHGL|nr:hypothetical protein AGLY_003091 [Aphis glycines]
MALPRMINGILRTKAIYSVSSRSVVSHEPWKPGPYPKTEEERLAAAKKYGLLPEEYAPYPDDGLGFGDYPKLPDIGQDSKSEYYPWDCPEHNRNFGEIMHVHADMWGSDKGDPNYRQKARYPDWQRVLSFFVAVFGISGLMITGDYWCKRYRPFMPKQWPQDNVKYYTYSDKYF